MGHNLLPHHSICFIPLWHIHSWINLPSIFHPFLFPYLLPPFPLTRDAKLAVLEWDQEAHTLRTRSLHYWEGDGGYAGVFREGRKTFALGPRVVTDPMGR